MLKMLDKHVYTICARTGDMQAQLSMLDRYVEDVVQNLLQGPYNTLAAFNKGKEKQEPYQIVVLKDFPYGTTPEMARTIQRIIVNNRNMQLLTTTNCMRLSNMSMPDLKSRQKRFCALLTT